jgi:hypothetical protein
MKKITVYKVGKKHQPKQAKKQPVEKKEESK